MLTWLMLFKSKAMSRTMSSLYSHHLFSSIHQTITRCAASHLPVAVVHAGGHDPGRRGGTRARFVCGEGQLVTLHDFVQVPEPLHKI